MYRLVYEDKDLIIVNKPAGMLCVPGLSEPQNLFELVKKDYPNARTVHRLDMATSGLVIFPLNHATQKHIGQQFEHKLVSKSYACIVSGVVTPNSGEIHSALMSDWENRPRQKIDWINGKQSSTYFEVISRCEQKQQTQMKLTPITGRTHQLRLHMLQIEHPILGDYFYHKGNSNKASTRLMLHAQHLNFTHPSQQTAIDISCESGFKLKS
ncbi:MAG: RNA pseudouridine synthase [Alteromonadaceae bacterium]|nr:MAG: RNA pseudouridine synthase [Alteromonadaceae bacterium]